MARHLYVAGIDRYPAADDVIEIEKELTYLIDTGYCWVSGFTPVNGQEIIIEDDDPLVGRLFAGIIVTSTLVDKDFKTWEIHCDDYTTLLNGRLVVETYENMSASDILLDVVAKYCTDFTTVGVVSGAPTIEYLVFEYVPVGEVFNKLCDYVGWHWQPTYYKDIQFFPLDGSTMAPMAIQPGGNFSDFKHSIDTQGLRNRVYVLGGKMLSDAWTYEVEADGVTRTWLLPHSPHELSIKVGGVPKTVGVENLHEDADYDYMMNYQEKYVRASSQTALVAKGTTMSFTYKYDIAVITMVEDLASQTALASVLGSNNVYEHSIVDESLVTLEAAEAAGYADLLENANPKVKGSFNTTVPGWAAGQRLIVNLPDRDIYGDYLIQRVTVVPFTSELWEYHIEYGGRLIGLPDVLKALISTQKSKKLSDTGIINKFITDTDYCVAGDEVVSTYRTPPWYCGEADAICGFVEVSE